MTLDESGHASKILPMSQPCACIHSRIISDSVTEEEHNEGKVRCVECGAIVPDPYLKREGKEV